MTTNSSYDCIIIGAGIIGTTIAMYLSEAGKSVLIMDKGVIGNGTTANTFAWINATSKTSNPAYFELNLSGLKEYESLSRKYGSDNTGFNRSGMIDIASDRDAELVSLLHKKSNAIQELNCRAQVLTDSEIRTLEPAITVQDGDSALYCIDDAWLDVETYLSFVKKQLTRYSVEVCEDTEATKLTLDETGRVNGIETTNGHYSTENIVIATGSAFSTTLAELTDYPPYENRFPMQTAPGLLLRIPESAISEPLTCVTYINNSDGLHFRPMKDGGCLAGSDYTDGLVSFSQDEESQERAADHLLEAVKDYVPGINPQIFINDCYWGIGVRSVPLDDQSILGPIEGSDGLILACTHSGITLAPIIGKLISEYLADNEIPDQMQPFLFKRFTD